MAAKKPTLIRSNSKLTKPAADEVERIHITYLDCRGRLEPALLMLEDAQTAYSLSTLPLEVWRDLQEKGQEGPPRFPFHLLPTLEQGIAHDGRSNIFSETSAILRFLSATLRSPDLSPAWDVPIATARHDMILEASLAFTGELLSKGTDQDWLSESKLNATWRTLVKPFLLSIEYYIGNHTMPPLLVPALPKDDARPGTQISAASAASAYAVELAASLFGSEAVEKHYPGCIDLRDNVYKRERIQAWLKRTGQLERSRIAIAPFATHDLVSAAAKRIAKGDLKIRW